ncbi:MAG: MFS transporter [Anaerolineae bacterium]|nr:MFS transporter [Anaerolineae bacterium]
MNSKPFVSTRSNQEAYVILALVAFGVFIAADDLTVISTMLPQMIFDFEIPLPSGLDDASWIVSSYLITHVVAMPLLGRISDIYGRRRLFMGCMFIFAVGSLLVAQATTLPFLIFARVVQAIGGGGVVPVAMAVVGDVFPPGRRAYALGLLGAVDTLGWIIGPLYGAFWVRYFTWQWQFYINIPISLLAMAGAWRLLADLDRKRTQPMVSLDWGGAALLSAALIAINVGLARSGGQAATGPTFDFSAAAAVMPTWQKTAAYMVIGGLALGIFIWLEQRLTNPLVDMRMFRAINFAIACLINFAIGFVLIIAMVAVPLFVNAILAEGATIEEFIKSAALESGQVLSALTGAMAVASIGGGWLATRFGYRLPTVGGLLLIGVGFFGMNTWTEAVTSAAMALHLATAGLGFGLVIAPVGAAAINAVAAEVRGVASGIVIILRLMGMSLGLSSLTAWGLHRFDVLSAPYSVAEIGQHIEALTAQILNEMFLASAIIAILMIAGAFFLRLNDQEMELSQRS